MKLEWSVGLMGAVTSRRQLPPGRFQVTAPSALHLSVDRNEDSQFGHGFSSFTPDFMVLLCLLMFGCLCSIRPGVGADGPPLWLDSDWISLDFFLDSWILYGSFRMEEVMKRRNMQLLT